MTDGNPMSKRESVTSLMERETIDVIISPRGSNLGPASGYFSQSLDVRPGKKENTPKRGTPKEPNRAPKEPPHRRSSLYEHFKPFLDTHGSTLKEKTVQTAVSMVDAGTVVRSSRKFKVLKATDVQTDETSIPDVNELAGMKEHVQSLQAELGAVEKRMRREYVESVEQEVMLLHDKFKERFRFYKDRGMHKEDNIRSAFRQKLTDLRFEVVTLWEGKLKLVNEKYEREAELHQDIVSRYKGQCQRKDEMIECLQHLLRRQEVDMVEAKENYAIEIRKGKEKSRQLEEEIERTIMKSAVSGVSDGGVSMLSDSRVLSSGASGTEYLVPVKSPQRTQRPITVRNQLCARCKLEVGTEAIEEGKIAAKGASRGGPRRQGNTPGKLPSSRSTRTRMSTSKGTPARPPSTLGGGASSQAPTTRSSSRSGQPPSSATTVRPPSAATTATTTVTAAAGGVAHIQQEIEAAAAEASVPSTPGAPLSLEAQQVASQTSLHHTLGAAADALASLDNMALEKLLPKPVAEDQVEEGEAALAPAQSTPAQSAPGSAAQGMSEAATTQPGDPFPGEDGSLPPPEQYLAAPDSPELEQHQRADYNMLSGGVVELLDEAQSGSESGGNSDYLAMMAAVADEGSDPGMENHVIMDEMGNVMKLNETDDEDQSGGLSDSGDEGKHEMDLSNMIEIDKYNELQTLADYLKEEIAQRQVLIDNLSECCTKAETARDHVQGVNDELVGKIQVMMQDFLEKESKIIKDHEADLLEEKQNTIKAKNSAARQKNDMCQIITEHEVHFERYRSEMKKEMELQVILSSRQDSALIKLLADNNGLKSYIKNELHFYQMQQNGKWIKPHPDHDPVWVSKEASGQQDGKRGMTSQVDYLGFNSSWKVYTDNDYWNKSLPEEKRVQVTKRKVIARVPPPPYDPNVEPEPFLAERERLRREGFQMVPELKVASVLQAVPREGSTSGYSEGSGREGGRNGRSTGGSATGSGRSGGLKMPDIRAARTHRL